jgi:membrane protein required for colicin V production
VNTLDGICLVVLLASLLLGVWRGLLYEVLAIAGWAVAFVAARWAAEMVGARRPLGDASQPLHHAAGFALVFVVVAFTCGMLASLARYAAKSMGMRPVDRLFGAAFGIARGLLLLLALDALALMTPLHEVEWWRASVSAYWLDTALMQCLPLLPPALGKYLSA